MSAAPKMTDTTAIGGFRPHAPPDRITVQAKSAGLYYWFVQGYTEIHCTALHRLCLSGRRPPRLEVAIDETMPRIELERGWFWSRLTVHTASGRSFRIGGLRRERAEAIKEAVTASRSAAAAARQKAVEVGPRLIELAEEAARTFDGTRYVRHSSALPMFRRIESVASACRPDLVRRQLHDRAAAALQVLENEVGSAPERFEASREAANERFVASVRLRILEASAGVIPHPPTVEQAAAMATDEDVTLVLAGAGAGKTAVIIGKVAHLVRNRGAPPSEILVLAFNRKAAQEVNERLERADRETDHRRGPSLADVEVRTFNSFGHRVLAETTAVAPTLSRLAEDDRRLGWAVTNWLKGIPDLVLSFIAGHRNEYRSPFDFGTFAEYIEHCRSCELRSLSGDRVKSQEELRVANFLSLHGVHFEYEADYRVRTANRSHRQYRPDFYLPDHDLYIEHFALDENGRAPRHFRNYESGVDWKRKVHREYGTRLIETFSWQCRDGVLEQRLRQTLRREGVTLTLVPSEELLRRLGETVISSFASLVAAFLQHVRSSDLTADELKRRAANTRRPRRNRLFLEIFERIRERYESSLAEERTIDYNDQIIRASELIERERWTSPYRYVLVDEFQDISAGRMRLLRALRRTDTAFFLVGDDWQSIYRFTGSDVSLFRHCGRHLGHVKTRNLGATFRYGNGILEPTADFVQRNPVQTRRELETRSEAPDEGIILVPTRPRQQGKGVVQALSDIETREIRGGRRTPASVLALGRYNASRNAVPSALRGAPSRPQVEFSTVHRAKGREADYGIVLDLNANGFPARKEDDPVMEMVLPQADGALPYGEERRLFYVAATRAKRGTYLVVDAERPSPFVIELLKSHPYHLRKLGAFVRDHAPSCPRCGGSLIPSKSGKNLRCTNSPICDHLAPRCWKCHSGHLVAGPGHNEFGAAFDGRDRAVCNNTDCRNAARICPQCREGALFPRNGRYGPFWGCSRFASAVPQCKYTEDRAPRDAPSTTRGSSQSQRPTWPARPG